MVCMLTSDSNVDHNFILGLNVTHTDFYSHLTIGKKGVKVTIKIAEPLSCYLWFKLLTVQSTLKNTEKYVPLCLVVMDKRIQYC